MKLEAVQDNNVELVTEILGDISSLKVKDDSAAELSRILQEPHFQVKQSCLVGRGGPGGGARRGSRRGGPGRQPVQNVPHLKAKLTRCSVLPQKRSILTWNLILSCD